MCRNHKRSESGAISMKMRACGRESNGDTDCSCTEDGLHLTGVYAYSVDVSGVSLKTDLTHLSL